jgi:elongation factor Ts
MSEITMEAVKELRDRTKVGMMACKNALTEANGDVDAAIDLLRKRGEMKAGDKSERETAEGLIAVSGNAIVKLLCETDFVARNENFVAFVNEIAQKADEDGADAAREFFESVKTDKMQAIGENLILEEVEILDGTTVGGYVHSNGQIAAMVELDGGEVESARDVAMHATAMDPLCANPEDVDADLIEKEKSVAKEELLADGKPENIIDKIIEGKIKKFCADRALSSQAFVKDPSMTVAEFLGDAKITKFIRMAI